MNGVLCSCQGAFLIIDIECGSVKAAVQRPQLDVSY